MYQNRTKEELVKELRELRKEHESLKASYNKDITERKRIEEELLENQKKYYNLYENAPVGIYRTKIDGSKILEINNTTCEMLGFSKEEMLSQPSAIRWADPNRRNEIIKILKEQGVATNFDADILRKDGSTISCLLSMIIYKDEGYIEGFIVDITERKRVEEALQGSEERFRIAAETSNDVVYEWDLKQEVKWFGKIDEMLGYAPGEFPRTLDGFGASVHPEDWIRVMDSIQAHLEGRAPYAEDYRVLMKDGTFRWWSARGVVARMPDGKPVRWIGTVTDITERKQTEEALRDLELKFRTIFDKASDGIILTENGSSLFYLANNKICEMLGYTQEEILKIGLSEIHSKKDLPYAIGQFERLLRNEISLASDIPVMRKDGSIFYADINSSPVNFGGKDYLIGIFRDITERKQAEQALWDAKENLELRVLERTEELLKSKKFSDETGRIARVGGWELDLIRNSLSFSDVTKQIHEVDPAYQPTLEVAINFYAPEAIPVISEAVRRAIEEGKPYDVELELITAKQNRIWVRAIGQAYRENGEIVKIGGVFQDINERKLAEIDAYKKSEQLQLLSNELEIIIDSIPGLVFYKDTNNRFIRVNKYISDAYNMSKKQLEGVNLDELHTKEQAQVYYEADLQVIQSRQSKINIDEPWETETGTRWVSTSKIPYMDETGEVIGVIGVSLDVTERKLAEEELKKHREHLEELVKERTTELADAIVSLERSNKELEQFAYVASHDLQEPLRMISSYTQLLEKRYKDKLDADANDFIQFAVDGANRMQKLINDLLDYSRITSRGKDFTRIEISQLLGQAISNLQQLIADNTALVTNEDLPVLNVDESQIIRVFQNLIENAIKYKKKSELPKIHISCKKKENLYEFAVRDNGIGMNMQFHDRVFTIFQRLHSKEEYPGTGIGLSICKRIVERHGGKIWFESEENEGTTFYFTLKE